MHDMRVERQCDGTFGRGVEEVRSHFAVYSERIDLRGRRHSEMLSPCRKLSRACKMS